MSPDVLLRIGKCLLNRVPVAPIGLNPDVSIELEHMNTGRHRSIRGEAYLLAHQGKEAATEFQKILYLSGSLKADISCANSTGHIVC